MTEGGQGKSLGYGTGKYRRGKEAAAAVFTTEAPSQDLG
jgi:hypothetical protein